MPRNKHPEETVQKILDASLEQFVEKGYDRTTVLDIVENMGGMTRGAFYHHFKSKEEVLKALHEKLFSQEKHFVEAVSQEGMTGLEKIRGVLRSAMLINFETEEHTAITRIVLSLLPQPHFLAEQLKGNQETAQWIRPLVEEGMADGSIRPGNAKLLTELTFLLMNFWIFSSIFPTDRAGFMAKVALIKEILNGLGFPLLDESFDGIGETIADLMELTRDPDAPPA